MKPLIMTKLFHSDYHGDDDDDYRFDGNNHQDEDKHYGCDKDDHDNHSKSKYV